jgi:hypothetical protein
MKESKKWKKFCGKNGAKKNPLGTSTTMGHDQKFN